MNDINHTCVDRFLKYVKYDTQSDPQSNTFPSTEKQKILGRELVQELLEIGLQDAAMDEFGYVTATLAGNSNSNTPTIGLISHMDTSPDVSGKDVNPIIHKNYQGGDIILGDSGIVISAEENSDLQKQIGHDIITSDGTTLLGADDKAGIAEIFDAVNYLAQHPEIKHGPIKVAVTPAQIILMLKNSVPILPTRLTAKLSAKWRTRLFAPTRSSSP